MALLYPAVHPFRVGINASHPCQSGCDQWSQGSEANPSGRFSGRYGRARLRHPDARQMESFRWLLLARGLPGRLLDGGKGFLECEPAEPFSKEALYREVLLWSKLGFVSLLEVLSFLER